MLEIMKVESQSVHTSNVKARFYNYQIELIK